MDYNKIEKESIDRYFPKLSKKLSSGLFTDFKFNVKDTKMCKKYINNSTLSIYDINSNGINACTFPGISNIEKLNTLSVYDIISASYREDISQIKVSGEKENLTITPKINFVIMQTKAFAKTIPEPLKFATYLHEMGHWKHSRSYLPLYISNSISGTSAKLIIVNLIAKLGLSYDNYPLELRRIITMILFGSYLIFTFFGNFMARRDEFLSDKFAKDAGWGNELADMLSYHEYGKKYDEIVKNRTMLENIKYALISFLDNIKFLLPYNTVHPTTEKRIQVLKESDMNIFIEGLFSFDTIKNVTVEKSIYILDSMFKKISSLSENYFLENEFDNMFLK